jgi:hypothetical protein
MEAMTVTTKPVPDGSAVSLNIQGRYEFPGQCPGCGSVPVDLLATSES